MRRLLIVIMMLLGLSAAGIWASSPKAAAFNPFGKLKSDVCGSNAEANANSPVCTADGSTNPVSGKNGVLIKVTNLIAIAGGIAAVIIIIIGGLQYVLSTGDATRTNSAKNTILYALIGLVVILVARTIITFILNKL